MYAYFIGLNELLEWSGQLERETNTESREQTVERRKNIFAKEE